MTETVSFPARAGTRLSQNRAAKPTNLVIAFEGSALIYHGFTGLRDHDLEGSRFGPLHYEQLYFLVSRGMSGSPPSSTADCVESTIRHGPRSQRRGFVAAPYHRSMRSESAATTHRL